MRKPRFSTLRIISSKEDRSPCSVIADEDLTLDLKQGTPWTSNHGAGVRCFISAHEKNLPNRFVSQDEELGGGADAGTTPRRTACEILYLHSIQDMKFRKS